MVFSLSGQQVWSKTKHKLLKVFHQPFSWSTPHPHPIWCFCEKNSNDSSFLSHLVLSEGVVTKISNSPTLKRTKTQPIWYYGQKDSGVWFFLSNFAKCRQTSFPHVKTDCISILKNQKHPSVLMSTLSLKRTNEYSFIETYWRQLVASRLNRSVILRSQVRQPTVGCGTCL